MRPRYDMIQAKSDLDFDVKSFTVYFYAIEHNFQFDY